MTARVVRMLNGEDVIADVKEVRKEEDGPAFAYRLTQPYTVAIQSAPEVLFETDEHAAPVDFPVALAIFVLCFLTCAPGRPCTVRP